MTSPVLDLLLRRAVNGGRAPHRDAARVALCIEGGAMRGVISAGMVVALERLGLLGCFDAVYGSSAGAMNGAYFVAGQAALGTTIYHDDINHRDFVDMLRPLRGKPILNLDFLVDDVMVRRKPLATERVLASPVPLVAVATDAVTGERHLFRDFSDGEDLRHALRAGATMPVFAGPPYAYRTGWYLDALITEPIPVAAAEADGYTHILALLTRPHSSSNRAPSLTDRYVIGPRLARVSSELGRRYAGREEAYNAMLGHITQGRGPRGDSHVLAIQPQGAVVDKLERRRPRLLAGAAQGYDAVVAAMTASGAAPADGVTAFDVERRRWLDWQRVQTATAVK